MRPQHYAEQVPDVAQLVSSHTNLVRKIAWHFHGRVGRPIEVEDLIQAGYLGLIDASQRYSPRAGVSFTSYAAIRVRGAIVDYLRRNSNLTRSAMAMQKKVRAAQEKLEHKLGRAPDPAEISAELRITPAQYEGWLRDFEANYAQSLDQVYSDHSILFQCKDETPEDALASSELKNLLRRALSRLPEREALVLQLYYNDELNLMEVGAVLGVTTGRVSQIKKSAVEKLRVLMDEVLES